MQFASAISKIWIGNFWTPALPVPNLVDAVPKMEVYSIKTKFTFRRKTPLKPDVNY